MWSSLTLQRVQGQHETPFKKLTVLAGQWWHVHLIPSPRRQRHAELCEFKASLVYRARCRIARATQRNPASKKKKNKTNKQKSEKEGGKRER